MAEMRAKSLHVVKTFKVLKQIIWQSAKIFDDEGKEVDRDKQEVDLKLLIGLMDEIKLM